MLIEKEPYTMVFDEGMINVKYGQWQDDGTGRAVQRYFNVQKWEVNPNTGEIIDPNYVSPEEAERILAEREAKAAETAMLKAQASGQSVGMVWKPQEPELMLADRLNIKDPTQAGYMEIEDIQEELKKLGVNYHHRAGRERLLSLLKKESNVGVEN